MHAANNIDILLVEDNPADIFLLKKMLNASSLQINTLYTTDKVMEAQRALKTHHFHVALLDLSLPDSFGIETYLGIKPSTKEIPVIILTGFNDTNTALEALKQGAQDYLVKGNFDSDLLSRAIQYSLGRKEAEEALLVSEEKYKQMFYQNFFPSWIYEPVSLKILEVNHAAINKYGYTREEFLTLTLKDIMLPEDILKSLKANGKHNGQVKSWSHKKKDGNIIIVEVTHFPVNYIGKVASQAQIHDVTEEVKLQRKIKEQQKTKQKNITAAVLKAQESERAHLGEELHDNINQILATAMIYLEHANQNIEAKDELITKSLSGISLAIEEIRKLSRSLIVSDITEIGLKQSIQEMIENVLLVKKMQISLSMEDFPEKKIDVDVKIAIYRIIQEQFTNILKHAHAGLVNVELKKDGNQIILEIKDDGNGFDTSNRRKGVGITNMISRASLFDGKVKIESEPGKGCSLQVTLQLKSKPHVVSYSSTCK